MSLAVCQAVELCSKIEGECCCPIVKPRRLFLCETDRLACLATRHLCGSSSDVVKVSLLPVKALEE